MTNPPNPYAALEFTLQVEGLYAGLIAGVGAEIASNPETSLGGKLLYAGQLDASARALLIAANIAGAASLAASANADARKQAFRDGVVDFLVTSLDEALRILKNQLRKREPVAVCIDAESETVSREMLERGVLPALLSPHSAAEPEMAAFLRQGALPAVPANESQARKNEIFVVWSVASAPAIWLPRLDAVAADCLSPQAGLARRWLRMAPRYLGRMAPGLRLLRCDEPTALRFQQRVQESIAREEIGVAVELQSFSLPTASIRAHSSFTP